MGYDQRVQWVFLQIIEGLCQGKPLSSIAEGIVIGLGNIIASDERRQDEAKRQKRQKRQTTTQGADHEQQ